MGKMHKRLTKAINKSRQYGSEEDAEVLAAYLIARGWRDTEKRPVVQQVTVTPSLNVAEVAERLNDNLELEQSRTRDGQGAW